MIKHQVVVQSDKKIIVGGEECVTSYTFDTFTDKGKLSKQDERYHLIAKMPELKERAENEVAKFIQLVAETELDMQRALELKSIVDNADFNGKLVAIKFKLSNSKWYRKGGELNMRSQYSTCVPASVEKEARELQAIRKKHQGNEKFDFYATQYKTVEIREADHDNF